MEDVMEDKTKRIVKIVMLIATFAIVAIAASNVKSSKKTEKAPAPTQKEVVAAKDTVKKVKCQTIVYYFMTTYRCRSCTFIENATKTAVEQHFADQIKDGSMVFKMINVDEPQHKHYVNTYGLYTKTVILSSVKDGKQLKWKNLDQVWNLIGQDESFKAYISGEVKAFLKS
jgi:hypothetical protein